MQPEIVEAQPPKKTQSAPTTYNGAFVGVGTTFEKPEILRKTSSDSADG